jgi:nicotinamidase-related amidase
MTDAVVTHNRFASRMRPERTVLVLVDCQGNLAAECGGDLRALRDNAVGFARLARAFGLPLVVGAVDPKRYGRVFPELASELERATRVERDGGSFWDDPASIEAVRSCGRREAFVAGVEPQAGLAGLALGAKAAGFTVKAVADVSAGGSDAERRRGIIEMSRAGIEITSWVAVMAELFSVCPT